MKEHSGFSLRHTPWGEARPLSNTRGVGTLDKGFLSSAGRGRTLGALGGVCKGGTDRRPDRLLGRPGWKGTRHGTRRCLLRGWAARHGTHLAPRSAQVPGVGQGPDGSVGMHAKGFRDGSHGRWIAGVARVGIDQRIKGAFARIVPNVRPVDYQRLWSTRYLTPLRPAPTDVRNAPERKYPLRLGMDR